MKKCCLTVLFLTTFLLPMSAVASPSPNINDIAQAFDRAMNPFTGNSAINFNLGGDFAANNYSFMPNVPGSQIIKCVEASGRPGKTCEMNVPGTIMVPGPVGLNRYPLAPALMNVKARFYFDKNSGVWNVVAIKKIALGSYLFSCRGVEHCEVNYDVPSVDILNSAIPKKYEVERNVGIAKIFDVDKLYRVFDCSKSMKGITCFAVIEGTMETTHIDMSMTSENYGGTKKVPYTIVKQGILITKKNDSYRVVPSGSPEILVENQKGVNPLGFYSRFSIELTDWMSKHPKDFGKFFIAKYRNSLVPGKTSESAILKTFGPPISILNLNHVDHGRKYKERIVLYTDTHDRLGGVGITVNPDNKTYVGFTTKYYDATTKKYHWGYGDPLEKIYKHLPSPPMTKK